MVIEALKWLGLLFLVISLLQDNIALLRFYGIISTSLLLFAYTNDLVLIIIHLMIIGVYIRVMFKAGHSWRHYMSLAKRQILDRL